MNITEIRNRVLDAENLIETAIMQMEGIGVRCENHPGTKSLTQIAVTDMKVVKAFIGTILPKFEAESQHTESKEATESAKTGPCTADNTEIRDRVLVRSNASTPDYRGRVGRVVSIHEQPVNSWDLPVVVEFEECPTCGFRYCELDHYQNRR